MDEFNDTQKESLRLLQKYLDETPEEELKKQWKDIEDMGFEGPTVDEYFQSLAGNPKLIYELNQEIFQLKEALQEAKQYIEESCRDLSIKKHNIITKIDKLLSQ